MQSYFDRLFMVANAAFPMFVCDNTGITRGLSFTVLLPSTATRPANINLTCRLSVSVSFSSSIPSISNQDSFRRLWTMLFRNGESLSIPTVGSHFVRYREPPIPHGGASRSSFRKPTFLFSETKHFCQLKNNPHIDKEKCST